MKRRETWVVESEAKNLSPFQFLRRMLGEVRPGLIRQLIRDGGVRIDGGTTSLVRPLRNGAVVEVEWPVELYERARRKEKNKEIEVLYQDPHVLVVWKPAGVPVVADRVRAHKTVLELLPEEFRSDAPGMLRPRVVHRLDKHTSGALLLARDRETKQRLTQAFMEQRIHKEYLGLVRGEFRPESVEVEAKIGKDRRHANRMVIDDDHGKESLTRIQVERLFDGFTLLRFLPHTGRTHQIRVHTAHIGFPLLGDRLYGGRPQIFLSDLKRRYREKPGLQERPLLDRQALHCQILEFEDGQGETRRVEAPLAEDLGILLKHLEKHRPPRQEPG